MSPTPPSWEVFEVRVASRVLLIRVADYIWGDLKGVPIV